MRQNKERERMKRIDDATVRWSFSICFGFQFLAIPNNLWAYRERPIQTASLNQTNIRKYYLFSHKIWGKKKERNARTHTLFQIGKKSFTSNRNVEMKFLSRDVHQWKRCVEKDENSKKSEERKKRDENERKSTKMGWIDTNWMP